MANKKTQTPKTPKVVQDYQAKVKRDIAKQQSKFQASNDAVGGVYYSPYQGSMATRVSTPWFIRPTNPNFRYISRVALREMRNRSTSLEKNNPLARSILNRIVDNVVGPKGFQLQILTDDPEWNAEAERLMRDWFDSADKGGLTWLEHQRIIVHSWLRDGDIGTILCSDGTLQPIEGDLIDNQEADKSNIICGVEVDDFNNPINYYVSRIDFQTGKTVPTPIKAQDFVFFPRITRFGQLRGEPLFAPIFETLDQINQWSEAVLMAARIAACFGIVIKQESQAGVFNSGQQQTNSAGQQTTTQSIEPGMIKYLKPNESIDTVSPSQPGQSFPDNLVALVRLVGAGCDLPLELLLLDYSKASYASSRAAILQAYLSFQAKQELFIHRYLERIYRWRIAKFIKARQLTPIDNAYRHRWLAQSFPMLDPQREYNAIGTKIDLGLSTLTSELQSRGISLDHHIAQRQNELAKLSAAGIPLLHSQAMQPFITQNNPDGTQFTTPTDTVDDTVDETTDEVFE